MKQILREPLVHFLLLGAALFALYLALNRGKAAPAEEVVVTSGQIENLVTGFTRVWQRPPMKAELDTLIDSHVKEEILSREAMKLGLDQNDAVIRHRLQQKMEFIAEDFAAASEPTDAELADYLAEHPAQFAQERRFVFRQVFLDREKRGDRLGADVATLLVKLRQHPSADVSEVGDPLPLPQEFTSEPQRGVAAQFGQEFAARLAQLKIGEWSGPVQSAYGVHLVLVTQRTDGRLLALAEVRERVMQALMNTRRQEANQRFFNDLLSRYHVTIQLPPPPTAPVPARVAMSP